MTCGPLVINRELKMTLSSAYHFIEEALTSDSAGSPVRSSGSSLPPLLPLMLLLIKVKMIMTKVLMFTAIGTTNLFELRPSLSLLGKSLALLSLSNLGRWRKRNSMGRWREGKVASREMCCVGA